MHYSKDNIWKWVLLYVVIGAVAYGLVYYFFFYKKSEYNYNTQQYQNNSVETADWEIYRNSEYGFGFSYPAGVSVQERGNVISVNDNRQGFNFEWDMKFYKNEDKKSLESWINAQFNSFGQQSDKDCKIVPSDKYGSKVNIQDAFTVLIDAPSFEASCSRVGYYTISPDNLTVMEFNAVQASPELYQDILSTFKFTPK